jgi:acyl carrier protein
LGLGAYAAANAALDNAALRHGRAARTRWIAIDWDGWAFEPDAAVPSIAPEHGGSLFERIVTSGIRGRIAVSATPLHARLGAWLERAPSVAHEAAPAAAPRASRVPFVAPRTGLEASIAAVWSELLGVAEIGVDDDFFELGGHSLVAVRMLARLREFAGVPLTAATILEASTIAELAQRIDALRWAVGAQSSAVGEDVEEGEI